jgi:hypothetical protein
MVDKVKLEITPSASTTFPGDEFLMEPSERREKKTFAFSCWIKRIHGQADLT